jgi:NDP-4-keto-2,6-dideoxyhexose 3-C-methyltransferase
MNALVRKHGLEVFDCEYNDVNGASLRCYIGHRGVRTVKDSVNYYMDDELNFLTKFNFKDWENDLQEQKSNLLNLIHKWKEFGVAGLGASTKGNTLLQYYGITTDDLPCIYEISPDKVGKFTIGTNIPIKHESQMDKKCRGLVVFPWHHIGK